jgi:hypothetical protein
VFEVPKTGKGKEKGIHEPESLEARRDGADTVGGQMSHRTNPIFRRLRLHYADPTRPTRLLEDLYGGVIAVVVILVYLALMGSCR